MISFIFMAQTTIKSSKKCPKAVLLSPNSMKLDRIVQKSFSFAKGCGLRRVALLYGLGLLEFSKMVKNSKKPRKKKVLPLFH